MASAPPAFAPMGGARSRRADYPVHLQFLERWSPRAFTEATMTEPELMSILEAGRWAPSASNIQPWRFCFALRGDPFFPLYANLLAESNQRWAKNAAALVVVLSARMAVQPNGEAHPSRTHSFDAGCAWGFIALQAHLAGWAAHGMAGFEMEKARAFLAVPPAYNVEAFIAIGRQGLMDSLPINLRARELPSQRRPLVDSVSHGKFKG